MKKILLVAAVLICCFNANAQRFNVGAGFIHGKDLRISGNVTNAYATNGFFASVGAELPLENELTLDTGLRFLYQGSDENSVHYGSYALNIPFHGKYTIDFGSGIAGFLYLGPTLWTSLAVNEKVGSVTVNLVGIYKRFDVLAGAGAGIEVDNHFRLKIGYDRGMVNYSHSNGTKYHRSLLSGGVYYMF